MGSYVGLGAPKHASATPTSGTPRTASVTFTSGDVAAGGDWIMFASIARAGGAGSVPFGVLGVAGADDFATGSVGGTSFFVWTASLYIVRAAGFSSATVTSTFAGADGDAASEFVLSTPVTISGGGALDASADGSGFFGGGTSPYVTPPGTLNPGIDDGTVEPSGTGSLAVSCIYSGTAPSISTAEGFTLGGTTSLSGLPYAASTIHFGVATKTVPTDGAMTPLLQWAGTQYNGDTTPRLTTTFVGDFVPLATRQRRFFGTFGR